MMIVAVSRIPLPKTERYLYWVRVANRRCNSSVCFFVDSNTSDGGVSLTFRPPPGAGEGRKGKGQRSAETEEHATKVNAGNRN